MLDWAGCGLAVANADERLLGRGRRRDPVGARRRRRAAARGARRRASPLGSSACSTSALIRSDTERVRAALARREADGLLDEVLALDERRRALQTQVDELRAERNTAAQAIGEAKRAGRDAAAEIGSRGRAARPAGGARGAAARGGRGLRDGHARAAEPARTSAPPTACSRRTRSCTRCPSRPEAGVRLRAARPPRPRRPA